MSLPTLRLVATAVLLTTALLRAAVPPATASAPGERDPVRPTTTTETGDHGGTFFGRQPDPAKSHRYFIAAESQRWDYVPSGRDEVCGLPIPPTVLAQNAVGKTRYVAYTDATFGARAFATPSLGILGPVLRGVVGDYLVVTFLNRTSEPLSIHPHGVKYDKDSEGAYYQPGPGRGSAVAPGATFTYVWFLDESSGPLPNEPSSRAWLYHSHVTGDTETNLGLVGALIVTDPKRARPDGTPADVDREFATLFMIFDESGLDADAIEAAEYANLPGAASAPLTWAETQQALQQGVRPAINGRLFGNLPGLEMNEGERTRWYLFALGSEQDLHTAHWHGLRVIEEGRRRTDVVELLPASMKVADLLADNAGTWIFHCHVADHMREGMFTRLTVHARDTVGVSRSPAAAFLGYPGALASARLTRAELVTRPATATTVATTALHLAGAVTAYEGFPVFNQPFRIQLGAASTTFRPDATGAATLPDGSRLRITNATEFGVINGGVMEFEAVLAGAAWLGERNTAAAPRAESASASRDTPATFTLELGRARHSVTAPVILGRN